VVTRLIQFGLIGGRVRIRTEESAVPDLLERSRRAGLLGDPAAVRTAAQALVAGRVVAHGFANMYAMTTLPDADVVRGVNLLKGRPVDQVGSITTSPARLPDVFDWSLLPDGVTRDRVLALADLLFALGPIGLRGPAAAHVPDHLTQIDADVRTTQVIAPGYSCPSNRFLALALALSGRPVLYITSANRSRQVTGAADEPAHWRAEGLRAEFAADPSVVFLEHDDEPAAGRAFPWHLPMSTTVLAFHRVSPADDATQPTLVVERQGSLSVNVLRTVTSQAGFALAVGGGAARPLTQRTYG
jgi:hypothetical protein